MPIDYTVVPNTIKTLDVDGLIIPFNKGQNQLGSSYEAQAFDDTSNLNFALAIDFTDIYLKVMSEVLNKVRRYIENNSPNRTTDTYDVYNVSISETIIPIVYAAYKGLNITCKSSSTEITVQSVTHIKKIENTTCSVLNLAAKGLPNIYINDNSIGYSAPRISYIDYDGEYFIDSKGNQARYELYLGGYYFDDWYALGLAWNEHITEYNTFEVYSYNRSYLTYDLMITNKKLNSKPISVHPTEQSSYIYFITSGSPTSNNEWISGGDRDRMYHKRSNGAYSYYDAGYGLYTKDEIKSFFNTQNEPSGELTPIEPSGGGGDPYEKDPDSQGNNDPGGHKGGNGKYQDTDEDVPIPELPTISAADTGLCTLLNPTNEQLEKLSNFLWSDVFSVDSFKKIFADPMDVILGLSIVPLKVASDILRRIKISGIDTGVEMYKCASQYIEVDCGSIDITNYWDNFMDYEPYTQYTIYLPYVGYKVLHADELVDKTITVKYHCDILSGACMAYVQCGKKVLYCFEGNISIQIPVTSASYDNMIHGMLQVASGVGQIIAGGASMAAGGAGAGLMVSGAVGTATGATSAIKPTIGRSGNAESSTGLMGIQKPYLIISRPRAVVPSGLNKYSGYPAYKGGKLGDFNNFTVVQDIRIKNLNGATMEEMNEAERLCKEGVIV